MRICLASIHPRLLSGQIDGLVALGRGLRGLGHEVRLVTAFSETDLRDHARWTRSAGDAGSLVPKVLRMGRVVRDVARVAAGADVVHLNLPTPAFSLIADLVRRATGQPVVVGYEAHLASVRTLLAGGYVRRWPAFFLPRVLVNNALVARLAPYACERYVVSSGLQRRELLHLGLPDERIAVIPNLVDDAKLCPLPRDEARRRLGLPGSDHLIVYLGHYHPVKGAELLPEALQRVRERVPDVRLVLAWSGIGGRRSVEAAIDRAGVRDAVIERGRVDVSAALSAADVVAAPYTLTIGQSAFPAVPLEAMHQGVPLVTTDLPLLRELTGDGQAACLTAPGDVAALAAGLVACLTGEERAGAMVAAQRHLVACRYQEADLLTQYVALYEGVLDGYRNHRDQGNWRDHANRSDRAEGSNARHSSVLQPAGDGDQLRPAAVRRG